MLQELRKNKTIKFLITSFAVLISSLLQTYVIQTFIKQANLLSSGFTGVALLIDKIANLYGGKISTSFAMIALNLPVAIICYKSIGKKFTFFSLAQVFLTSFFLKILHFEPMFDDIFLNVIFGGFIYGMGTVIALKGNASTGGTDFIALYVSNKKGKSIWEYVFAFNVVILCIFGVMFSWESAGYSILFQFISTKAISTFHHRYERVTLQITTARADEVIRAYVSHCHHGISCIEAVGGYSRKKMYVLHTVVSSYEVSDIVNIIREIDPYVIINMLKTEQFYGGFYQAPID